MTSRGTRVTVCVDAMGGDFAPQRIVEGAVAAADAYDHIDVLLVGNQDAIREELRRLGQPEDRLRIVHAPEAIGMGERGSAAVRRRDSSLAVASRIMVRRPHR